MNYALLLIPLLALFAPSFCSATEANADTGLTLHAKFMVYRGDPDLDIWYKIPAECQPTINLADHLYISQKFTAFVIVCATRPDETTEHPDKIGKCGTGCHLNLLYSITDIHPDKTGTAMLKDEPYALVSKSGNLVVLPSSITGCFDSGDPLGTHTLKAEIIDKNTGKTAADETTFELKEWSWPTGDIDPDAIANYYKKIDPDDLHKLAFGSKIDLESWEKSGDLNSSVTAFLKHAYLWHDFLLEHYRTEFKTRNSFERKRIQFLLALTGQKPIASDILTDEELAYQKKLETLHEHDPYESLDTPDDLDRLLGEFFATGHYKPIRRLMDALAYQKDASITDAFLKSTTKPKTEKDIKDFWHGMVYKTGIWSIHSNCMQHDLVAQYCLWTLTNEGNMDALIKANLYVILSKKWPDKIKLKAGE